MFCLLGNFKVPLISVISRKSKERVENMTASFITINGNEKKKEIVTQEKYYYHFVMEEKCIWEKKGTFTRILLQIASDRFLYVIDHFGNHVVIP